MKKTLLIVFIAFFVFAPATFAQIEARTETRIDARPLPAPRLMQDIDARAEVMDRRIESREKVEMRLDDRDDRMDARIEMHAGSEMSRERIEMLQEKREERREALRERFDEQILKQRERFQEMYARRAIRVIAQVDNLINRFEMHIEKLAEMGIDTTEADASLNATVTAFANAKVSFEALKDLYPTNTNEWTDELKQQAQIAKEEAEAAIKEVHVQLRETLSILKTLRAQATVEVN